MTCSTCGKPLPAGVTYCPNCGTPTANLYSQSGGSPGDPTARASEETPPPPPFTSYGEQPYSSTPANPYETPASNPYNPYLAASPPPPAIPAIPAIPASPTPPPGPPSPPRRSRTGLIAGVAILVLILVAGGVFIALQKGIGGTTNNPPQHSNTSTASTGSTVSSAQLTATGQAQASATAQAALTATAAANATATASVIAANPNPYPPNSGTLALLDPLSSNNQGYHWDTGGTADGACNFTGGTYQISTPKTQFYYFCASHSSAYSNVAFEAQMKIVKGDCGGLIIRADTNTGKLYLFEICQNGTYNFFVNRDFNGNMTNLSNGSSSAIKAGLNQSNTVGITATGSTLTLYVNRQKVATITDGSYSNGSIALVVDAYNNPTTVAFSNARLWTL